MTFSLAPVKIDKVDSSKDGTAEGGDDGERRRSATFDGKDGTEKTQETHACCSP